MLQVPEALRPQLPVVVPAGELPAAGQPCAAFLPRAALLARLPNAAIPELPRPPACGPCRQAALTSVCPRALTSIGRGRSRVATRSARPAACAAAAAPAPLATGRGRRW
mmetsp:Transcript_25323/g.39945  ORF Transcript_25323/g.39945 Transcript_25323/m.39945 type:complete len:109 (-) Transcript_25323:51-377(-)